MKRECRLIVAFGKNSAELADMPTKISGTFISRILIGDDSGCSRCFPHGHETINSHIRNQQRCWKKQRRTQAKCK